MARLLLNRLLISLLLLAIISIFIFIATELLPGDVVEVMLGQSVTPEAAEALRRAMNLDQPAPLRYLNWVAGLLRGDPGISLVNRLPIADLVGQRFANTLMLAGVTVAIFIPVSLLIGIAAAIWQGSVFDRIASVAAIAVMSVPEFLVATLAVLIFAVRLGWVPAMSYVSEITSVGQLVGAYALPILTLGLIVASQMIRLSRAAVVNALREPWVEMARLKGASYRRIIWYHVMPNVVGTLANAAVLSCSFLVSGVLVTEVIFSFPGVAKLMVDAVSTRDMPLIQTCAMIFAASYLLLATLADMVVIVFNPRLQFK